MEDRRKTRFLLTTFSLGHLSNDWPPSAIWLLAPAIAIDMRLSPAEVGLLITIHSLGASLAYLPAGMLSDHVSNRGRLLVMTFWWVALGYFVASLAPNFWALALLLALAGMGDAAWHPIATGVLAQRMPGRRGEALGVHAMGGTMAEVLAPLAVGYMLATMDWRSVLQVSILPPVLMGIAFIWVARSVPRSTDGAMSMADVRHFSKVWSQPAGLRMIAMMASYNMAVIALMSMMPLFLQTEHRFTPLQAAITFAAALLIGSLAQPIVGRLSDTGGRKHVFITGSVIASIASITITLADGGILLVAAMLVALGVLVAIRSGLLALAVEFAAKREATTLGFVFMLMDGVGALGAVLAGLVGDYDLRYSFTLAAAFSLVSVALALAVPFRNGLQSSAPAEATNRS